VTSVNLVPAYVFGPATILSTTSYVVHSERGVIQSLVGPFAPRAAWATAGLVNEGIYNWTKGPRVIQVVYTVASGVADDILEAYAQLIGHWYRRVKTQSSVGYVNMTQQQFGDLFTTYGINQVAGLPLPPDIELLLAPYRVPSV